MLWRRDVRHRAAGKRARAAGRAVRASASQLRARLPGGQEAAAPSTSPRRSQNRRCHRPSPAVNSAPRTWRGKRGWEEPFWFRSLALIALCSPSEVLVSTSPTHNRAVSKEQDWVTPSSAAGHRSTRTQQGDVGTQSTARSPAPPACSTGLRCSTLWGGERSSPKTRQVVRRKARMSWPVPQPAQPPCAGMDGVPQPRRRERKGRCSVQEGRRYSRVGALPVPGTVLHAASRGVSPGSPWSSGGEASPVATSASHPAHGTARPTGAPRASRPPRTCKESPVNSAGQQLQVGDAVLQAEPCRSPREAGVTSTERGRHPPLIPWGHPAPHAVHRALLPREADFELAALEVLP